MIILRFLNAWLEIGACYFLVMHWFKFDYLLGSVYAHSESLWDIFWTFIAGLVLHMLLWPLFGLALLLGEDDK